MRHALAFIKVVILTVAFAVAAPVAAGAETPAAGSLERAAMPDGGDFAFLQQEETRRLFREAFQKLAAGPDHNPAAAVELGKRGFDQEPENIKGQILYAEILVRAGRVEDGLMLLREKSAALPGESIYKTAIAQVYFSQQRDDEAYGYLNAEIEKTPEDFDLRVFRADSRLFVSSDFAIAERDYRSLIDSRPADARLWTSLGFARFQQGKLLSAREAFTRALEIQPGYVEAMNNLAWVDRKEEKYEEALRQFDEVIRLKPDYRPAHLGRAYTLRDTGDLAGSIQAYKKLLELDPNFILVLDMLVLYVRLYLWVIISLIVAGLFWFGRLYLRTIRRDRRKAERALERR